MVNILKRTKAAYLRLFEDPTQLFPEVQTILFPNGQRTIWFKSKHKELGFSVTVGLGPRGLGIQVDTFAGTEPISIMSPDGQHVELCQYLPGQEGYKEAYRAGGEAFSTFVRDEQGEQDSEAYKRPVAPKTEPQKPDLLELAETFYSACEERLSLLRDFQKGTSTMSAWELQQEYMTDEALEDQVGHWEYLLDKARAALQAHGKEVL